MKSKMCGCCGERKDTDMFHKRSASTDGLAAKCKLCQKIYDKLRNKDPLREEARRIYAQTEQGRLTSNKAKAEYRKRNPNKAKAHAIVARNIRNGNLKREVCEKCGDAETHAHHDDYLKPLNVTWLCAKHHKQWHAKYGEAKNP